MTSIEIKLSKKLENGIEFSCQMCGSCCRGLNEGEVYLYKEDIIRLANFLDLKDKKGLRQFALKYLKIIETSFYWKEPKAERGKIYRFKTLGFKFTGDDEHCQFLVNNSCSVHKYRPFQCRCFPFWQMMVSSRRTFIDYTKKCKGLQISKGRFYSKKEILSWAKAEYEIERKFFLEMKKYNFDLSKVYPFLPKEMVNKEI
ncbi:MAG: YkgJ family cysteine cluster protein [Promethearchaeota archaeon]